MRDFESGLDADEVRRLFRYVKSTGHLIRRVPVISGVGTITKPVGSIAGWQNTDGYVYTGIHKRIYSVHRIAFLWVTGHWPSDEIDHKNGVRNDNRWKNLREATVTQNRCNTLGSRSRKGPYPGVYEKQRANGVSFIAQIKTDGEVIYLGSFQTGELARDARVKAERALFKQFAGSLR